VQRRVGVDRPDGLEQLGLGAAAGEKEVPGGDAHLVGRALLVAHVDLGGGIVADEDHGQPRLHRGLGTEGSDAGLDLGQDLRRDLLA
jgi:hypothetical protein